MNKKTLRNDLTLIASLILVAVISLVLVLSSRQKNQTLAKVYVQNELRLSIDLSKAENNDKDFLVDGINGQLVIHTKNGAICVAKSNCPHQDCVNTGYIKESNRPIICAYNAVSVVIEGNAEYDVVI